MLQSAQALIICALLGGAALPSSAAALPNARDAGLTNVSRTTQVRDQRKYRRAHRTPQRVMGLKPGPDPRRGRLLRLPR